MRRLFNFVVVAVLAVEALASGQSADANKVLADVREALGGETKLAAVNSLTVAGHSTRVSGDSSSRSLDVEMAMQLPDKFMKKEVVVTTSGISLSHTSGFSGAELIDGMDTPPTMGGGVMTIQTGDAGIIGGQQTPEQQRQMRMNTLLANRQEFARLTLGLFGTSFKGYPLTFTYAGQAEAPDGKADVIEVKGEGDFTGKLFVDAKTHLPVLFSWMAKEPMTMGGQGTSFGSGRIMANGATVRTISRDGSLTPKQRDEAMRDLDGRMKEADAARRVVEYRMYYSNYHDVDGIKLPSKIQRSIDGRPADELALERFKLNPKIDPKKFETVK